MNVRPESVHLAQRWLDKAEADLKSAEHLLTVAGEWPLAPACFHCQQCAEKYLKALLTFRSVPFPKSHDLLDLLHLVSQGGRLGIAPRDVSVINRYAVETRYPGEWEAITRAEAEEALGIARKVRAAVRAALPEPVLKGEG